MRTRVPSLASLSGLRICHCRELWCRSQMRLGSVLLCLWCRPIGPLAWELPYAGGAALKSKKAPPPQKKRRDGYKGLSTLPGTHIVGTHCQLVCMPPPQLLALFNMTVLHTTCCFPTHVPAASLLSTT